MNNLLTQIGRANFNYDKRCYRLGSRVVAAAAASVVVGSRNVNFHSKYNEKCQRGIEA